MAQNKSVWIEDWMDSASHMKMVIELGELDEQLGESDEDHHKTRRVKEQLGESDGFSLG